MFKRHELIPSEAMGRPMHLWRYGHWGAPVLVFPTAAGFAHEWEVQGMVDAIADLLEGGKLKLYCTESNVAEAWTRREEDPAWRIQRHQAFERYVMGELVPFVRRDCGSARIRLATAGCSLGAFYSATFALKFPDTFSWALCMSGRYEMTGFTDGFSNLDVYFNNPLAFVANLAGEELERVRRGTRLILVCGQGPWEEGCIEETHALADLLAAKGVEHVRDIWGHDVSHGWEWWRRQVRFHLSRELGG
jgi:esterase/lipase superfamily enzyme